jgi:hypothetical protein
LQIGHMLSMFAVVEILVEPLGHVLSLPTESALLSADGLPISGRSMRLRIESLLI